MFALRFSFDPCSLPPEADHLFGHLLLADLEIKRQFQKAGKCVYLTQSLVIFPDQANLMIVVIVVMAG